MPELLKLRFERDIATIQLDRPEKRNALSRQLLTELNDAVNEVQNHSSLRALVIEASGTVFCAGMDLSEMLSRKNSADPDAEWQADSDIYNELVDSIFQLEIPTLAKVQGPVLAGGMGLMLACDMVIASDQAFFQLPEPRRGIVAAMVTPLLAYRSSVSAAHFMLLAGTRISAEEGATLGFVHQVAPMQDLDDLVSKLIQSILESSSSALQMTKKHLRGLSNAQTVSEQIQQSATVSAAARNSVDAREGLAAFLEKRSPNWNADR